MNGEIFGYWLMMRLAQMGWNNPMFLDNPWRCPIKMAHRDGVEQAALNVR